MNILEIGCGNGGILLPFSKMGCHILGVDMAKGKIENAISFFEEYGAEGQFIAEDIFLLKDLKQRFDVVICHDVIEHIADKEALLSYLRSLVTPDGVLFFSFPAWQMPFGGHQQMCRNRFLSHFPFLHLLPAKCYKALLKAGGECEAGIKELLELKKTKCPIELFERIVKKEGYEIINKVFYFINPHYDAKFHLHPRKLIKAVAAIPHLRNYFTTSCFYLLKVSGHKD